METVEISQAERDRVVSELTRHCGDGRLTLDELEERIAEVYAATTTADIEHALRQLPVKAASPATTPKTKVVPREHPFLSEEARRGGEIALRIHFVVYLAVIGLLVLIWLLTTPFGYPWPIWPAMSWGVALAIHAGVHKAVWASHDAKPD